MSMTQLFTMARELAQMLDRQSTAFDLRGFNVASNLIKQFAHPVAADLLVSHSKFFDPKS